MFLSVLPLILGVLLIAAGLWLVWRRGRESGDDWAIGCMACGFPASDMRSPTSFVCPGCGGDVRIYGLAPRLLRSKRRRMHPLLRVGLFSSIFSLGAAILIFGGPWFRTDGTQLSRYTVTLAPPSDSPGLRSAEIVVDAMRADKRVAGYASVTLETDTGLATMEVTLPDRTATLVGDAGPIGERVPISAETFDALARQAGIDPADALVADQLEAIRAEFEPLAATGQAGNTSRRGRGRAVFASTSASGGSSGTAGSPAVRPARWAFAGLAVCWLAGVAFLLRRDRRAHRTSAAPIVAAPVTPAPASDGGVA